VEYNSGSNWLSSFKIGQAHSARPIWNYQQDYSQTSRKQPLKMSSLGGRLQEVIAYESLNRNGSKYFLIL